LSEAAFVDFANLAKRELDEYQIDVPDEQIIRTVREGSPSAHIAQIARDEKPDLIVMGTHGNGLFRRMLLGSVTMKVLHDVDCPVWTCALQGDGAIRTRTGINRILCSIDMSPETVPLLQFAKEVAAFFDAKVELVHTVPEIVSRPSRYLDTPLHLHLQHLAQEEISKKQAEAGTDFPLTITGTVISADIADLAATRRADLILIGRGHISQKLGSWRTHAYDIIRRAPCPVLSFSMACKQHEASPELATTAAVT